MYQTGGTIKETLKAVQNSNYVLPAIQREFVWKPEQICRLFDSLMQGYPFGTFLYWRFEKANSSRYKFYGFVCNFHERDSPHCPQLPTFHDSDLTAVLDGQQRLTALNIGLCGSMAFTTDSSRTNYCENHLLGSIPKSITEFRSFYEARRDALRSRISEMVATREADAKPE